MTGVMRGAFLIFLAGIGGTVVLGLRSRNVPAVVNGIVSIGLALAPDLVELGAPLGAGANIAFGPELPLWIAVAGFLHMVGMLGLYDSVRWWDHLTHTVSAALVAALFYASLHTYNHYWLGSRLSDVYVIVLTVLFTLVVGVFWEFLELAARELGEYIDRPPVLEYYGLRDTILDVIFDGVGAVVVVAFDIRVFVSLTDQASRIIGVLVVGSAIFLFVGTLGLGLLLEVVVSRTRA